MKVLKSVLIMKAILLVVVSTAAAADCTDIISLSKTASITISGQNEVDSHASSFCNEFKSSSGASKSEQFNASYKFLSASMGSGKYSYADVASKYCSAQAGFHARQDAYRQYVETIAPGAYAAYTQCIALQGKGIKFDADAGTILPTEMSIAVLYASDDSTSFKSMKFSTSSDVVCKWGSASSASDSNKTSKLIANSSDVLECRRGSSNTNSFVRIYPENTPSSQLAFKWSEYKEGVPTNVVADLQKLVDKAISYSQKISQSLSGSVVAFQSEKCPDGWIEYDKAYGRFILGAGPSVNKNRNGAPLSTRKYQDIGGEESHRLTIEEIPTHSHKTQMGTDAGNKKWRMSDNQESGVVGVKWANAYVAYDEPVGNGLDHNTMPPFVALTYCEKNGAKETNR